MAKEENKFSLRKIYIQLNAFIDTNKIVQVPVDDRKKKESIYSHLRKYIMLAKCTVQELLLPPLDVPYIGDHWNIGRLILSIRNCIKMSEVKC